MNEQHPTETSLSNAMDSFAEASHGYTEGVYPEGVQSAEMLTPQERVADFSNPSMPNPSSFLSNEPQDLAHMEFPPLAQPLTATTQGSLGSFAQDRWDEGSTTNLGTLSAEINDPATLLPLQSFATPDPIEAAQRLGTPFSLPSLPVVSFPSATSQFAAPQHGETYPTTSAASAASQEQASSAGLTASAWEPQTPTVAAFSSLSAFPQSPESVAPIFPSEQSALNVSPPNASFPTAPAFPSSPMAFEAPAFPTAPAFPAAPSFPTSFTPDPENTLQSFATPEPFDAGDSFGPPDAGETNLYQQVANSAEVNPLPSEQFPGPVDFSSNPLPRPEALILKAVDAPAKTSRFGRKKQTATALLSAEAPAESLGASVAGAALSPAKKAKRFGRKPAETVDLLGAPLGARTLEPSDAAAPAPLSPLTPSSLTAPLPSSLAAEETAESKPKRKLFATVDRSKEKPLTPNSGRGRKMVQGLAALSLLAGAGLFTMSFLDKKSPAPTPVAPVVETTLAQAPANPLAPAPGLVDPATGLPLPGTPNPVSPDATQPSADEPSTADTLGVSPDSIPTATPIDGAPVDTTPTADGQAPVATITPGPDDLEFSTGGNFSE